MASSMQFQLKNTICQEILVWKDLKMQIFPPVQCVSGLEQEAAGLETEESLAGFNIREANHTIFKEVEFFKLGNPTTPFKRDQAEPMKYYGRVKCVQGKLGDKHRITLKVLR